MEIFIPGNVPSSKNSRQWTGKYSVASKATQKYCKETEAYWLKYQKMFSEDFDSIPHPAYVIFKFIRGTRHNFDYINPAQTIQDLMEKYHWIPNDNCQYIIPVFLPYEYSKENPGVIIKLAQKVEIV